MIYAANVDAPVGDMRSIAELLEGHSLSGTGTLANQVYEILRDLVVSLKALPHQLLSELEIAEELNASKTPVREALIRLENANLVTIVPKSGTYVAPVDLGRYKEACFIRLSLEAGAIRLAAQNPNRAKYSGQVAALISAQERAVESGTYPEYFRNDVALHKVFADMAGIPGVWEAIERTQVDVFRVRHLLQTQNLGRSEQAIKEHKKIVAAVLHGDPDLAEAALVAHIGPLEGKLQTLRDRPGLLEFIEYLNEAGNAPSRSRRSKAASIGRGGKVEETCRV